MSTFGQPETDCLVCRKHHLLARAGPSRPTLARPGRAALSWHAARVLGRARRRMAGSATGWVRRGGRAVRQASYASRGKRPITAMKLELTELVGLSYLAIGGSDVTIAYDKDMDRDLNAETFAALERDTVRLFPGLHGVRFTQR